MTMANADGWIVMRQRVSLAGRVTAAGGKIAGGGAVSLTTSQGTHRRSATSAHDSVPRRYETRILADGFYFFLDLPAGDYVLGGRDERGDEIEARQVSIPPVDGQGRSSVIDADLTTTAAPAHEDTDGKRPGTRAPGAAVRRRRGSKGRTENGARA